MDYEWRIIPNLPFVNGAYTHYAKGEYKAEEVCGGLMCPALLGAAHIPYFGIENRINVATHLLNRLSSWYSLGGQHFGFLFNHILCLT